VRRDRRHGLGRGDIVAGERLKQTPLNLKTRDNFALVMVHRESSTHKFVIPQFSPPSSREGGEERARWVLGGFGKKINKKYFSFTL
jgi:hypothetical protein